MCICMARCPWSPEEDAGFSGAEVTGCWVTYGYWDLNLGPSLSCFGFDYIPGLGMYTGWHHMYYVAQTGLEFMGGPPASDSEVLGLRGCATTPD